jgi:integrase
VETTRLRKLIEETNERNRLRRDITLARAGIHGDIQSREDLAAALGRPVSAEAPMLRAEERPVELTAVETEQLHEATRTKGGPSPDYMFDQWFGPWCKGKSPDSIDNMRNGWSNHFRGSEMNTKPAALIEDLEYHSAILNLEGTDGEPMKRMGMRKWIGIWRRVVIKPLMRKGLRTYDPFEDIVLPKDKSDDVDEPKGYSMEDFQKLRANAMGDRQRAYLDIAMGLGGRPNEVLMLKESDFDLDEDEVTIRRARHGSVKDGQPKTTPLLPLARRGFDLIASGPGFHEDGWLFFNPNTGKPFNRNWDCGVKDLCEQLGIEYLGRYGFRHGYCYALTDGHFGDEWTPEEVAQMLRHRGMDSIKHYYRVNKKKLAEKAQRATVPEVLQPTQV